MFVMLLKELKLKDELVSINIALTERNAVNHLAQLSGPRLPRSRASLLLNTKLRKNEQNHK